MLKVHFIAIGGSVMHQLAIALHLKGYVVTGSDDEIFEPASSNLLKYGLFPSALGWDSSRLHKDLDAVILGMHAKADNPEIQQAKELGLKIYSFPEYIFEESRKKTRVAVGGSHGKTSTTAIIMHALKANNKDFDYLVGARLEGFSQSVNITDAPVIVCEADEYPASVIEKRPKFHFLFPHIAILTGIAWDHINVFPTFEFYLDQFRIFIGKIESGGVLIYNETDEVLVRLINENKREDIRYLAYGIPEHTIENGKTTIVIDGVQSTIAVFGNHNLLNMHAAYLVCKELGISASDYTAAVASFTGAAKRLELLANYPGVNVYRDFAHAPSKVTATMQAVQQQYPDRRLIAVLELHTFSSLNADFMTEYNGAMAPATEAAVFYSQHALELKRMPPLDPEVVQKGFNKSGLQVFTERAALEEWLHSRDYNEASLLLMSSGNYDGIDLEKLIAKLG